MSSVHNTTSTAGRFFFYSTRLILLIQGLMDDILLIILLICGVASSNILRNANVITDGLIQQTHIQDVDTQTTQNVLDESVTEIDFPDLVLTPEQKRSVELQIKMDQLGMLGRKRMFTPDGTKYWPYGIVPYEIDHSINDKQSHDVRKAMLMWQTNTCIRFRGRSSVLMLQVGHNDSVYVTSRLTGCSSYLGRYQPRQLLGVEPHCKVGNIAHELGHTLGFAHEHSRPDRDEHIMINTTNIRTDGNFNREFKKFTLGIVPRLHVPYDMGSLMHYGGHAFSKRHQMTIIAKDNLQQLWMGQLEKPSFLDIKTINLLYRCNRHCSSSTKCNEPAYVGPQCECICPDGLSGTHCEQVKIAKSGCGGLLINKSGYIKSPNYPEHYGNNENCFWMIKGSPGSRILLIFLDFELEDTCRESESDRYCDNLDVRVHGADKVGQRYDHHVGTGHTIIHKSNELMLHFQTDYTETRRGFKIFYQIL